MTFDTYPRGPRPVRASLPDPDLDLKMPLGFKLWFAFCALLGLGITGVLIWALIRVVLHFT